MNADFESKRGEVVLLIMAAVLLLLCFISGGNSAAGNPGETAAQLFSIPILIVALVRGAQAGRIHAARWAAVGALLILFLPLAQLVPLPAAIWSLPSARISLLQDLNAAGVTLIDRRWTLSPGASERNFQFMLPSAALFFCMLATGRSGWRRMLGLIIGLCVVNLAFAFVQFAAGQKSILNPYPEFAPALGGVFANNNHQADMLAIGLMVVVVFLLDAWSRFRTRRESAVRLGSLIVLTFLLLSVLPLVGSRAGVIVAMLMLVGALLSSGLPTMQSFRESRWLQAGSVLALMVLVVGLQAAIGWMKNDATDPAIKISRYRISAETLRIGADHAPLGAGIGTFIPAFQQGEGDEFLMSAYVNNAHNEYAQWWLEGGLAGISLVLLALIVLIVALIRLLRLPPESLARTCGMAAMTGIGVIALHSTVDYPLRSPALTAVFGVLAGIAVAAASRPVSLNPLRPRQERHPATAPQRGVMRPD